MEQNECECEDLRKLFELRQKADDLVGKCEIMESFIDWENLSPNHVPVEEIEKAITYQREAEHMHEAVREYRIEIRNLIRSGKITRQRINRYTELYCSTCGQYIDEILDISSAEGNSRPE